MRSPLGRALGLGAAREGIGHWWSQRLTAVALIPLVVWLVYSLIVLGGHDYPMVVQWLRDPAHAVLLLLFLFTMFYHSYLGVQVVLEDYVHVGWLKVGMLILVRFLHVLLAAIAIFAVLNISLGGPG